MNLRNLHLFVHNDSSQSSCTQRLSSLVFDLLAHCGFWDAQESCAAFHVVNVLSLLHSIAASSVFIRHHNLCGVKFVELGPGKMAWSTHLLYEYLLFHVRGVCI